MSDHSIVNLPFVPGVRFAEIPGFPGYCVGDDGSVWSCLEMVYKPGGFTAIGSRLSPRWRRLKPVLNKSDNRFHVQLRRSSQAHPRLVHRLVLLAFRGEAPPGTEGAHDNGNPHDNRLTNLFWKTRSENQLDRRRHKTDSRGENNVLSKLTDESVAYILEAAASGSATKVELARRFGISTQTVYLIIQGKTWRHVPRPAAKS